MKQDDMTFDWSIAPITREAFFAQSYEKKHLVIKRNDPNYYRSLVSVDDIDHAVSTMGLNVPEVTVVKANSNITPADYAYESGFVDAVRVNQLFADGATIIMANLQERVPSLARFCRALENVFSCRVQTNIYLTPANSQGFRAHYDNHDVLVQQVEGTKEWRIYDHPVELPLNTQAFNPHDVPIGEETDRFVLEPGDMVYVPRGLSHDAVATDQTSLHITTGLMTRTWADLIAEAVVAVAHQDPAFRASLPPGYARSDFDISQMQPQFDALLERLSGGAGLMPLMEQIRDEFISNRVPRAHGQMSQIARLPNLNGDSLVSVRPQLIYQLRTRTEDDGSQTVQLSCQGSDIMLPGHVRQTVEHCLTANRVKLSDLQGDLDVSGKTVLVKRLIREGLMISHV